MLDLWLDLKKVMAKRALVWLYSQFEEKSINSSALLLEFLCGGSAKIEEHRNAVDSFFSCFFCAYMLFSPF